MNIKDATLYAAYIFGLAFVISMLVALMIKALYLTVRHFSGNHKH
jgi:hypothetical protein